MNVDPAPTIVVVSIVPITISELFKGGQECDASVGKEDAYVEKMNPYVGKMNALVGKADVLTLKRSL